MALLFLVRRLILGLAQVTRFSFRVLFLAAVAVTIPLVVGYALLGTDRDVAYRYAEPQAPACDAQAYAPITLADDDASRDNDEIAAIERTPALKDWLTCMLQHHEVEPPRDKPGIAPVRYYLGFAEFSENGSPADVNADGKPLEVRQVQAIVDHLRAVRDKGRHNYVIAFIHGWRHNASIGDTDVQKLRVMAAYTASFLRQRCEAIKRGCNTDVTAVYFGWRGARVDESFFTRRLGSTFGQYPDLVFGVFPALLTLFDRKPVSERISGSAITALRWIDENTYKREAKKNEKWKQDPESRMITFGHSLGGNMLASSLRDTMVDRIARHVPGTVMTAPFGDLIVLLNPASEAWNWTAIQRAMRERMLFVHPTQEANLRVEIERQKREIDAAHAFFPKNQAPIYVSLGSANTWPAGGIRKTDLKYMKKLLSDEGQKRATATVTGDVEGEQKKGDAESACEVMARRREILFRPRYDWATHDLFPAFRFDFRAAADTLEEIARGDPIRDVCETQDADFEDEGFGWLKYVAGLLRNFPFMNTDTERTRTIGHLIPTRSPLSSLSGGGIQPASSYGTTHELTFNLGAGDAQFALASYRKASDPAHTECATVDNWLWRARHRAPHPFGVTWDSGDAGTRGSNLTPVQRSRTTGTRAAESQFRHGLLHSGMVPVVRANDPFWNVRVFETGMQDHGEYTSYPLICAVQQLVMDKVAEPVPLVIAPPPSETMLSLPAAASLEPAIEGMAKAP